MNLSCNQLAERIEELSPNAGTQDVARLCLLLCNAVENPESLNDNDHFQQAWKDIGLRLQAATDQHAAMARELEELAHSDPEKFTPEQVWILIRAIKVQSQILQLYVGQNSLDV